MKHSPKDTQAVFEPFPPIFSTFDPVDPLIEPLSKAGDLTSSTESLALASTCQCSAEIEARAPFDVVES